MHDLDLDRGLRDTLQGRRVLITGHTGFKGGWLAVWAKQLGASVCGYSLEPPTDPSFFELVELDRLIDHNVIADVGDREQLAHTFSDFQPEVVFHLAAQAIVRISYDQPKLTFDTNVGGTVNLLECVRETASVRALVNCTSDKCYENKGWIWGYRENDRLGGNDPYSASKGAAELVAAAYLRSFFVTRPELGAATVRAGNVVGGGDWAPDRIVPDAVRALSAGSPVPVRNPGSIRPWQHVLEPLSGYLLLAAGLLEAPDRFSGPWNFGPDPENARSVRDLVEELLAGWGSGDWEDLSAAQGGAPFEATTLRLNCDKAQAQLGWAPRWGFTRTVRETLRWYKAHSAGDDLLRLSRQQIAEYVTESGEDRSFLA